MCLIDGTQLPTWRSSKSLREMPSDVVVTEQQSTKDSSNINVIKIHRKYNGNQIQNGDSRPGQPTQMRNQLATIGRAWRKRRRLGTLFFLPSISCCWIAACLLFPSLVDWVERFLLFLRHPSSSSLAATSFGRSVRFAYWYRLIMLVVVDLYSE